MQFRKPAAKDFLIIVTVFIFYAFDTDYVYYTITFFLLVFVNLKAMKSNVEGTDVIWCFKGKISIQNLANLLHPILFSIPNH